MLFCKASYVLQRRDKGVRVVPFIGDQPQHGFWYSVRHRICLGLAQLVLFLSCTMLMDTDNTAINHQIFQVGITGNSFKNLLPYPLMGPTTITDIDTMPVAILRRQITPGRTCTDDPKDAFNK